MSKNVDLSEFATLGRRNQRKPCPVPIILEQIDANDHARVEAAFSSEDEDIRRGVRLWLAEKGIDADPRKITPHRARKCPCYA